MFRNTDHVKGGPGDPKDIREWWRHFKGWPARSLLVIASVFAASVLFTLIYEALHP